MRVVSHLTWTVELLGQLGLGPVELLDGHAQPHGHPSSPGSLVTRTAATL
jgi:hypothetical protein